MKIHELKILTEYFQDNIHNQKNFEIRENDRDFKVGDALMLKEWDGKEYTGCHITMNIGYITDFMQKDNYVVMGIY